MDNALLGLMLRLNIGRSAATAYSVLLTHGPLTVSALSALTDQPALDVRHALRLLVQLRLVNRDRTRYYVIDPDQSWTALEAELVWSRKTSLSALHELPQTEHSAIEHLRVICSEMKRLVRPLYRPYAVSNVHKTHDAETAEELEQLKCEVIGRAEREILSVSRSPRPPAVASIWAVLTERLQQNVAYRRITDLHEIMAHGLSIVWRDLQLGIELEVLEQNRIKSIFYVVDQRLVVITHRFDNTDGERRGVGRVTTQRQIVRRYRERFDTYHAAAMPARFVLRELQVASRKLVTRAKHELGTEEAAWVMDIVQYGKFSKFHVSENWSEDMRSKMEDRLTQAGFLWRNAYGELIPRYALDEPGLRAAYSINGDACAYDSVLRRPRTAQ